MFYDLGIGGTVYTLGIPALSTAIVIQLFTICPPVIALNEICPNVATTESLADVLIVSTIPDAELSEACPSAGVRLSEPDVYIGVCC